MFTIGRSEPVRFVTEDGQSDPCVQDDQWFFLYDAHKYIRDVQAQDEDKDASLDEDVESAKKKLRPSREAVSDLLQSLVKARAQLDPIFDVLRGMDPSVGLLIDHAIEPPVYSEEERLRLAAASLQRRREALNGCATDLRASASSLASSAAADRAVSGALSDLRTRWRLDWDASLFRLEANTCFLPRRVAQEIPLEALGGPWGLVLGRDREGVLVGIRSGEAVRGEEAVEAELLRRQGSYWSKVARFELQRQIRGAAPDVHSRYDAAIKTLEAALLTDDVEQVAGPSDTEAAALSPAVRRALGTKLDLLYLAWLRRCRAATADPFSKAMAAQAPKPSDLLLPLVEMVAHSAAVAAVRLSLANQVGPALRGLAITEQPKGTAETEFQLRVAASAGAGPSRSDSAFEIVIKVSVDSISVQSRSSGSASSRPPRSVGHSGLPPAVLEAFAAQQLEAIGRTLEASGSSKCFIGGSSLVFAAVAQGDGPGLEARRGSVEARVAASDAGASPPGLLLQFWVHVGRGLQDERAFGPFSGWSDAAETAAKHMHDRGHAL